MGALTSALWTVALACTPALDTLFVQVAPISREAHPAEIERAHDRAVVLLHGLRLEFFHKEAATRAALREWQKPESLFVRKLGQDADVFAFAYAQNVAADEVAEAPALEAAVARLRQRGYREVVLVGFSAGGLIARQFVEDNPDAGVTKVVQVCSPNDGSTLAHLRPVRTTQVDFLNSLTRETRRRFLRERADKKIPEHVEFVCAVGTGTLLGDGVLLSRSQWPEDLQRQGIPAYSIESTHWHILQSPKAVDLVGRLVRTPQPRWTPKQVAAGRKQIFG